MVTGRAFWCSPLVPVRAIAPEPRCRALGNPIEDDRPCLRSIPVRNPPICVECLIRETGVTRARVTAILTSGDAALKVVSYSGSCSGCRETKRVFRPRDSN